MSESTLTLRVGGESVIFKAVEKDTQEGSREDKVSSLDLDDDLLEKELAYLQEDTSDTKGELEEIERLIKEVDYQESIKSVQNSPTRRVVHADSTSTFEKLNFGAIFTWQPISTLTASDVQLLPDHFENLLEENEDIEDVIYIGNAHFALLEGIMEGDEVVQEKNKGSSKDESDSKAGNDDSHHSSIESPMLDQEEVLTKRQRTKRRANVYTMFEVLAFTTPDSIMNKKASKEGMERNKHGKGMKRKAEESAAKKRMEDLRKGYKRKIHLYKTKYKVQRLKKEILMEEATVT
uniref:Uncharacterized protein n=1 Tax=Lactuca sativa TaxID=4236 RepID=A0A9R1VMK8_LACSA|nr:hypothetical protein LSAT_V11C500249890 [Lactuca sativa]